MPRTARPRPARSSPAEWVGARVVAPFQIDNDGDPYNPEISFWLELPSGLVLASKIHGPGRRDGGLAGALKEAMKKPLAGEPRVPPAVRVPTRADARRVLDALPDDVPVRVAPTPEIDRLVENMASHMAGPGPELGWLADDRIDVAHLRAYFGASRALYLLAPWRTFNDAQVVRADVPALSVRGACLSLLGGLGEVLGFLVFPSLDAYERFLRASLETEAGVSPPPDVLSGCLSLTYERVGELPEMLRRRLKDEDLPVAGPKAFPHLERHDAEGEAVPLGEGDLRLATALNLALTSFCARHREELAVEDPDPICETFDSGGTSVTLTCPYEDYELFYGESRARPPESRQSALQVGRNDPCPCGSGRKYKKCHLREDENAADDSPKWVAGSSREEELRRDDPEVQAIVRDYKTRHYEAWIDDKLPALGGKTPREAARSAELVRDLEALLDEMESRENCLPVAERYDFSQVRRKLGLSREPRRKI